MWKTKHTNINTNLVINYYFQHYFVFLDTYRSSKFSWATDITKLPDVLGNMIFGNYWFINISKNLEKKDIIRV